MRLSLAVAALLGYDGVPAGGEMQLRLCCSTSSWRADWGRSQAVALDMDVGMMFGFRSEKACEVVTAMSRLSDSIAVD